MHIHYDDVCEQTCFEWEKTVKHMHSFNKHDQTPDGPYIHFGELYNISDLGKRKVLFKSALGWDMLVSWRVLFVSTKTSGRSLLCMKIF